MLGDKFSLTAEALQLGDDQNQVSGTFQVPGEIYQVPGKFFQVSEQVYQVPGKIGQVSESLYQVPGKKGQVSESLYQVPGKKIQVSEQVSEPGKYVPRGSHGQLKPFFFHGALIIFNFRGGPKYEVYLRNQLLRIYGYLNSSSGT